MDDKDRCLHGLTPVDGTLAPRYYPPDVLRVNQIFTDPNFFVNGATASDIAQGGLGDCWFLSGLSLIATAGLVENVCVEVCRLLCLRMLNVDRCQRDEQVGVYGFIFWRDAGWVDVIIDE